MRDGVEPAGVEAVAHIAHPVRLLEMTCAIIATSTPCADNSTICTRRHVTTDPEIRRTVGSSRAPSSLLISRTRTRSAMAVPGEGTERTPRSDQIRSE